MVRVAVIEEPEVTLLLERVTSLWATEYAPGLTEKACEQTDSRPALVALRKSAG